MKFILTLLMSVVIGIVSFLGATYTVDTFINQAKHEVRDIVASWKPTKIERELIVGDTQRFLGGFPYNLSGGGVSSSATSFTLSTFTLPQNDYPIQDSDLSDTFYITFEPGNKDRQEIASCTTVGSNSGGTVTISGCTRGLSPVTPYTASTTLQFPHSGGSRIVFSNPPQLYDQAAFKENDETITGLWEFDADNPPKLDATGTTATSSDQLVSKEYVDNVTAQGAATSSETVAGIIEQATAIETASTTQFDANNPHTINSEQATSTPTHGCDGTSTVGALCVAVAENDGKLSQLWIDLTEDFTWTGHHIFSSLFATNASTTNATTTNLYVSGDLDISDATVTGDSLTSTSTVFTSNGTWTKPNGAKIVEVFVWGAGGGGGGGERDASDADGGSGGGGGAFVHQVYDAADLSATESVTVGTGGTGGAGEETTEGSTSGTAGGASSFSSGGTLSQAGGGGGGTGGSQGNSGGTGGVTSPATGTDTPTLFTLDGGDGADARSSGGNGCDVNAVSHTALPASGASGGGGGTTNGSNQNGCNGGTNTFANFHETFGFIPQFTASTTDVYTHMLNADGGDGGDASATGGGTPGDGGVGSFPGGGGGGGGGKDTDDGSQFAGDGANGGDGLVIVITHF